jgi:hypothetical protein
MKMRLLLGLCVFLSLGVVGSSAVAAVPSPGTCSGGSIPPGTYKGFTVTGNCIFADGAVTIKGDLVVARGALLNDHAASSATVHVTGNVLVGKGAVLGLGDYDPSHNNATVDGNIIANQPLTLYLGAMTVHGSVVSNGGGDPGRNFPIKDDRIDGSLIINGWSGLWMGVIRDTVRRDVIVTNNVAVDTSQLPGSDSTEVMTNNIHGDLICFGNSPAAQINPDDGGLPNTVDGRKIGQCAGL